MLKPYRVHEAEQRASSFSRRPIVLARLPFVGQFVRVDQHETRRAESPTEQQLPLPPTPAPPSTTARPTPDYEPPLQHSPHAQSTQHSRMEAANFVAPHLQTQSYVAEEQVAQQTRQPRVDAKHAAPTEQQPASHSQSWSRPAESSSGLFQLQKQIATNSGLIVSLALIASAVFLYMAIIAPVEPPTLDYSNSYEFYGMNQAAPTASFAETESSPDTQTYSSQAGSPALPLDPFELDAAEAPQDSLALNDKSHDSAVELDTELSSEGLSFKPAKASANIRPEVVQLPQVDEESNVEVELIFDDASALIYPNTHRPIIDFGPLKFIEDDAEQPTADSAVANRPQFDQLDAASR